jgi:hypothetical protein
VEEHEKIRSRFGQFLHFPEICPDSLLRGTEGKGTTHAICPLIVEYDEHIER